MMGMAYVNKTDFVYDNYPSEECGRRVIKMDGHNIPETLTAIFTFFIWIRLLKACYTYRSS